MENESKTKKILIAILAIIVIGLVVRNVYRIYTAQEKYEKRVEEIMGR